MRILSIETSCDETAVALVDFTQKKDRVSVTISGEKLHSQAPLHAPHGGVYPSLAKREHQHILPIITETLLTEVGCLHQDGTTQTVPKEIRDICSHEPDMVTGITSRFAGKQVTAIDAIAVTYGPGLAPALWVGVNFARSLALLWDLPLIPVNHMEGHIFAALFDGKEYRRPEYPLLSLLVSGGHTELVLSPKEGVYEKIGATLDDAAGEAFDKVARLLGLSYPGGPAVSALAAQARAKKLVSPVTFPRPMIRDTSLNFSYAGLKTAVRVFLEKQKDISEDTRAATAAEFEDAVVDTLIEKTSRALEAVAPATVAVAGGVSANTELRRRMTETSTAYPSITLRLSNPKLATDNAVMIALAGYTNRHKTVHADALAAEPRLSFPVTGV